MQTHKTVGKRRDNLGHQNLIQSENRPFIGRGFANLSWETDSFMKFPDYSQPIRMDDSPLTTLHRPMRVKRRRWGCVLRRGIGALGEENRWNSTPQVIGMALWRRRGLHLYPHESPSLSFFKVAFLTFSLNSVLPSVVKSSGAIAKRGTRHLI